MDFEERDRLFKGEFVDVANENREIVRLNPDFFIESIASFLDENDNIDTGKYKRYTREESFFDVPKLKSKIQSDYKEEKQKLENLFQGEERMFKLKCLKKQFNKRFAQFELIASLISFYVLREPMSRCILERKSKMYTDSREE